MGSLLRSSIFWYADKFPQKGLRGSRIIHTHGKRLKDELSGKSLPPMKDVRQTPRRGWHYVIMFEMEPLDWVMSRKRNSHACTGYVGTLCILVHQPRMIVLIMTSHELVSLISLACGLVVLLLLLYDLWLHVNLFERKFEPREYPSK